MNNLRLGLRVKKIRELKNLTQEHMAHELGMSNSGYSRIERGDVDINMEKLERIAEVLGVTLDDIKNFDSESIFQNFGTARDQSFSRNTINTHVEHIEELYKQQIDNLKDEVAFLRQSLRDKEKGK